MGPCPEVKIEETPEVWLHFLIKLDANPRREDKLFSREGLPGSQEYIPLKSHRRLALLPSLTKSPLVLPWFSLNWCLAPKLPEFINTPVKVSVLSSP